jgi:hypothetical protein
VDEHASRNKPQGRQICKEAAFMRRKGEDRMGNGHPKMMFDLLIGAFYIRLDFRNILKAAREI